MPKLGIIGGLGAAAGVRMAQQLVELAQHKGATRDQDFPRFVLLNVPARGMSEYGIENGDSIRCALRTAVRTLARIDCEYIVVACNTAHLYHQELNQLTHSEVLNMIEIAADQVAKCRKVGILCSETTRQARLYERALVDRRVVPVRTTEREQASVNLIIANAISGKNDMRDTFRLLNIIDSMIDRGAEQLIVGCTELPLTLNGSTTRPLVDAGRAVMAKALSLL
jgi:aspartate racemase